PFPYPWCSIGDKEDVIRLGDLQSLQVGAEQGEHRIWPLERGVNEGSKAGLLFPLGIHHIHDQHLGFTPGTRVTPPPLLGLRSPSGLSQSQASPIAADHDTPPR